ncbi:RNA binding methyltransferase [Alkalibacterium sp. AK22]|uniref:TlyA family RNA methyltransferase n=1 Tax=Alkalibacterium sp. AK22 TaxID=1229520 RepID=UPI0004523C46|nr:TlyA family RNA methyltransferase [Alkalibacterium sp. AK22]EXJ22764.1 RNA binding methyltransferase [Alkalibacterium sp. AK22]
MKKRRADDLLIEQGWAEDRQKAMRLIMSGKVYTDKEEQIFTAGEKWPETTLVYVKGAEQLYVSRGGQKLEHALEHFGIDLSGKTVLDIGSSTGGFTDVSLQKGAKLVYALDVGTNQLAWKLRVDPRVVVMEQTNFRTSRLQDFTKGQPDFASIDVSFISLERIFPVLKDILAEKGEVVALIKPQFEAAREEVGEGGIVLDPAVHEAVLERILIFLLKHDFQVEGLIPSPIRGGKGNKEYLAYIKTGVDGSPSQADLCSKLLTQDLFTS